MKVTQKYRKNNSIGIYSKLEDQWWMMSIFKLKYPMGKYFLIFFTALFAFLALPFLMPIRNTLPKPLVNDIYSSNFSPLSISTADGRVLHKGAMSTEFPEKLRYLTAISLKVGTYQKTDDILHAMLKFSNSCIFSIEKSVYLEDGENLRLTKEKDSCQNETSKEGEILIETKSEQRLAFISYSSWSETYLNPHFLFRGEDNQSILVAGNYEIDPQSDFTYRSRVQSILKIWEDFGLSEGAAYTILFATLMLATGCFTLILIGHTSALTMGALALSLGLLASIIAPPYQGPDELDHFLAFVDVEKNTGLTPNILEFAGKSHYDRLMCHVNEKLDGSDLRYPMLLKAYPVHVGAAPVETRSAYTAWIWGHLREYSIRSWPISRLHFFLRIFNSLYVAMVIFFTLALAKVAIASFRILPAVFPILFIPTFWHFTSHNSNHGIMLAHFLPWLLVVPDFIRGSKIKWFYGVWLGISLGLAVCAGRSGLIFLLIAGALCIIRFTCILFMRNSMRNEIILTALVWSATALPLLYFKDSKYIQDFVPRLINYATFGDGFFRIIAGSLFLATFYFGLIYWLKKSKITKSAHVSKLVKLASYFGILLLCIVAVFPIFKNIGNLPNIESPFSAPDKLWYLRKMLKHFWLQQGIGGNDFFLIESFWGGFGCPEPVWPSFAVQGLKLVLLAGLLRNFLNFSKNQDFKDFLIFTLLFSLTIIYFLLLGFGVLSDSMNIHGRYLVPFYILYITVCLPFVSSKFLDYREDILYRILGVLVPIVSLYFVLGRYF